MKKARILRLAFSGMAVVLATPAQASTLPRADFEQRPLLALGGGQALGLSFDVPLNANWSLGAALGSRAFVGARAEFRALYRLVGADGGGRYQLAGMFGSQAAGPAFGRLNTLAPLLGITGAYQMLPQWTLRASLAGAYPSSEMWRSSGIEVGYRYSSGLELTIGYNGRGDLLGLKLLL